MMKMKMMKIIVFWIVCVAITDAVAEKSSAYVAPIALLVAATSVITAFGVASAIDSMSDYVAVTSSPASLGMCKWGRRCHGKNGGCPYQHDAPPAPLGMCRWGLDCDWRNRGCPYQHDVPTPHTPPEFDK